MARTQSKECGVVWPHCVDCGIDCDVDWNVAHSTPQSIFLIVFLIVPLHYRYWSILEHNRPPQSIPPNQCDRPLRVWIMKYIQQLYCTVDEPFPLPAIGELVMLPCWGRPIEQWFRVGRHATAAEPCFKSQHTFQNTHSEEEETKARHESSSKIQSQISETTREVYRNGK